MISATQTCTLMPSVFASNYEITFLVNLGLFPVIKVDEIRPYTFHSRCCMSVGSVHF